MRLTLSPEQIDEDEGVMATERLLLTVTVTVSLLLHPAADEPVTTYEVVDEGVAITLDPVLALSVAAGDHT